MHTPWLHANVYYGTCILSSKINYYQQIYAPTFHFQSATRTLGLNYICVSLTRTGELVKILLQ